MAITMFMCSCVFMLLLQQLLLIQAVFPHRSGLFDSAAGLLLPGCTTLGVLPGEQGFKGGGAQGLSEK